jgi:hypothetical protein
VRRSSTILFDGRDEHTLAEIECAAAEFEVGQYFRIAAAGLAAVFAVLAALECYRARLTVRLLAGTVSA